MSNTFPERKFNDPIMSPLQSHKENLYQKRVRFYQQGPNFESTPVTQTNTFHIGEYCKNCGAIRIGPSVDSECKNCLASKANQVNSVYVAPRKKSEFLSKSLEALSQKKSKEVVSKKVDYNQDSSFNISYSKDEPEIDIDNPSQIPKILRDLNAEMRHHEGNTVRAHHHRIETSDMTIHDIYKRMEKKTMNQVVAGSSSSLCETTDHSSSNVIFKSKNNPLPTKMRSTQSMTIKPNLLCYACNKSLKPGEMAICAQDMDQNALFHPGCFCCSVCKGLLVDLNYYTKGNDIYCEKHFNEIKSCAGCHQVIKSDEYLYAENKYWHLDHFKCSNCSTSLDNQKYTSIDANFYCLKCHETLFPKFCKTCGEKIATDDLKLTYDHLDWHADPFCFKCTCCSKDLTESHFLIKKNKLFCGVECKNRYLKQK